MLSATNFLDKPPSIQAEGRNLKSKCHRIIDLLTLMPFCLLQEDHISLSLLHVRYHQEVQSGLRLHAPCLARRHQGSSILLRLAFLGSRKYSGALRRQKQWGDGL